MSRGIHPESCWCRSSGARRYLGGTSLQVLRHAFV